MTAIFRVTEVYPEITVADAHQRGARHKRGRAQQDGGVKDTTGRSRGGAKEHSRGALRERVMKSERSKAKNKY